MKGFFPYAREILALLGDNRRRLPLLVLLFLLTSTLDIVGLGIIGPYIALALNPEALPDGRLAVLVERLGRATGEKNVLIPLGVLLIVVFLFKVVAAIVINWRILRFSTKSRIDLQSTLMRSYQQQPYAAYLQRNSSEYIKTVHEATGYFVNGVQALLNILSEGIVVTVIFFFLAFTNGKVLTILAVLLATMMVLYDRVFHRRAKAYGQKTTEGVQRIVKGIHEGMTGFKELRILGKAGHFHRVVKSGATDVSENWAKATLIAMAPRYLLEFVMVSFVIVFILVSLAAGGDMKAVLPTLAVFAMAALRLLPSANLLTVAFSKIGYGRYPISLLYRDFQDVKKNAELEPLDQAPVLNESFRDLSMDAVSFRYPGSTNWALNGLTMSIRAGESIGIIGPSGGGKTTLIDVILGLHTPQVGVIKYNDHDLQTVRADWRSQVAYLPQEIFLVDNTLRCNIALGVDDAEIDDARVHEAIKQAQLTAMVKDLPRGLDTMVGERGVRLSGGQRQRVAIARAFYFKRDVLVLDEATSALDNDTEKEIVEEIRRLKGQKTMIVIAHRLTTVQHCDRIYKLEGGKVVKFGSYEEIVGK